MQQLSGQPCRCVHFIILAHIRDSVQRVETEMCQVRMPAAVRLVALLKKTLSYAALLANVFAL